MTSPRIIVSGVVEIASRDREAALDAARKMAAETRREEGCRAYAFYTDIEHPDRIRIFEEWENAEALERHFRTPHMAAFQRRLAELKIRSRALHRYEVTDKREL